MGTKAEDFSHFSYYLDGEKIDLEDFVRANHFTSQELFDIVNMSPGQTMPVGGGAGATFKLYYGKTPPPIFMCYWGEGYTEEVELHDISWFNKDNGYGRRDIELLKRIDIGQTNIMRDEHGTHIVTRVR